MIVIIEKSKRPTLVRCASGKRGGNCHRKGMHFPLNSPRISIQSWNLYFELNGIK